MKTAAVISLSKIRCQTGSKIKTGVRQGCFISGFFDYFDSGLGDYKRIKKQTRRSRWRFTSMLENLDYKDDVAFLSSHCTHIQGESAVASVNGLGFSTEKTIGFNSKSQALEEVEKFVYLGSEMGSSSGAEPDISRRPFLARCLYKAQTNM